MTYHLLDHCNRRNAAELARTDLDARALGTLEWVPSSGMVEVIEPVPCSVGKFMRSLGFGNKISCSNHILENAVANDPAASAYNSRYGMNVCRPFDEAHMIESACPRTPPGATLVFDRYDRRFWPEVATPPNHGHGAKCGCITAQINHLITPERNAEYLASLMHEIDLGDEIARAIVSRLCPWCAGTGRIICDDERAGRVSPSHAAGGYAEWQRCTMEFSVTDHDGTRPLGRITNMRSVDGFVVGDIELEDGSVVVERLMRSPFSSSEIGDAEPATTERE